MRKKHILWTLLAILALAAGWMLNVELTYERNVRNMPASFELRRHVVTRLWRI